MQIWKVFFQEYISGIKRPIWRADRVDVFGEAVAGGINTLVTKIDRLQQQLVEQDSRIANMLELGVRAFRRNEITGCHASRATSFENRPANNTPGAPYRHNATDMSPVGSRLEEGNIVTAFCQDGNELDTHALYRMKPRHRTLTGLYDEWMGIGDFSDVYDGIEGQNSKHGPTWRKHLSPHLYSRTARTVEGIRAFVKEQGMDIQYACDSLQVIYESRKCSVANMVNCELCES
jgi:Transcriptional activator of glycolytic enzymes